jgi:hypothetical protein
LARSSAQNNAHYTLSTKEDENLEYGFAENFCQLFELRVKLKKMRMDIDERGYTSKNSSVRGNTLFNTAVHYKSLFFERFMKPMIEELNMSDNIIG